VIPKHGDHNKVGRGKETRGGKESNRNTVVIGN